MNNDLENALREAGWEVGDAADFLGMTDEQRRMLDLRMEIARAIRTRRSELKLSQEALATRINSTQPRVSLIEAADPDVSLDQLARTLVAIGGNIRVEVITSPSQAKKKAAAQRKRAPAKEPTQARKPRGRTATAPKGKAT